jgi:hypothetical protein
MKKALRFVRKFLFWCFFVCLFLLTTLVVVLHIYEDEIKQYAIDAINAHLKTDIEVRSIELSIFHDFPRASLEFNQVLIRDAFGQENNDDTLLFSKRLYCTFNIWDIWNGDYKVNRIAAEDSKLNLRTRKNGDVNYHILKETEDSSGTNFQFVLELLRIDRLAFSYANLATGQFYDIDMRHGLVRGNFTESRYELVSEADLFIHRVKSNSLSLINHKPAHLDLKLDVNSETQTWAFKQGDLTIGHMPFEIVGMLDSTSVDLGIKGKNIELAQLANSISAGTQSARKYQGTGIVNFEAAVVGELSATDMPSVTATFDITDGTLTEPVQKLKVYDISLKGEYRNAQPGREELLTFQDANLKLLNSYFSGDATIRNFARPVIDARMKGNLELATFQKFLRIPKIEKIGGNVNLDLDFVIAFSDPQYRAELFSVSESKGSLVLKNVLYKNIDDPLTYENINGEVIINGNDAAVKELSVKTDRSDLVLNGAMNNLMQYIAGAGNLGMIASLESNYIDLNEFIGESNVNEETAPSKFELPGDLNLNIDLDIKDLKWDHHNFTGIGGKLLLANRKATATNFTLETLGGSVSGNLVLDNLVEAGNIIEGSIDFNGVDVKRLFAEWENFDQDYITDKHLSGSGKGSIDLLLFFNPYFSLIEEKIYALSTVEINNGELNDLETMKLVTDYMRSNKALKLMLNKHIDKFEDKLMHLKFSKLANQIEIKDRKIHIPKMKIITNALDLELFGWHDFDNNVEYHFSFRFRDLKTVPEYTEFGKIEDDGLGLIIYLTMTGPIDDPSFALDKEELKNDLKQSLAEEKLELKSMLKTEFGFFKKDSTVQELEQKNKSQVEFIFYDQDVESADTNNRERNKNRSHKLFDKMRKDVEEQPEEVEFEEDLDEQE